MRPGHFRLQRCPLIYHQKSGQKRGGFDGNYSENMLQLFPAPALPPYIPPEKRSKWRRQPHIFLKNLPSLTGTFLDDFRTGPAGIFQNSFHARQFAQPEPPAMHWRGKTSSHIPRHFFAISKWGSRKFFDTALCSGRDATEQEKGAAL